MIGLLVLVFAIVLSVSFAAVFFVLRVRPEERVLEQRLQALQPAARTAGARNEHILRSTGSARVGLASVIGRLHLVQLLQQLAYQATGQRAIGSMLLIAGVSALVGMAMCLAITGMPPVAGIAGVLCGSLPIINLYRKRQKRLQAFERVLPDCIDMCGRALRAGHSLVAAIGIVAEDAPEPAKTEFAEIFRKQNYGLPLRDAFAETLDRVPSADLRVFVTGILVQKDTGGNLTEIFDRIVGVIRERVRIQGEIRVHTTQGRLTGWILTLLPMVLLVLINLLNPGYSRPLFTDPTGRKLLYAGMGLLLLGGVTIRRIVNGIEV